MKPQMGRGDDGLTDLLRGGRVLKNSPHVEAIGAVDEAVAAIGLARALLEDAGRKERLKGLQLELRNCAGEIAAPLGTRATDFDFRAATEAIEAEMAAILQKEGSPEGFITPGETPAEAALDVARTLVRRAERRVFALDWDDRAVYPQVAAYLNRLSDLLFAFTWAWKR